MVRQFGAVLLKKYREEIERMTEGLARGQCKSFEEYKNLCGMIRGLELAEDHLKTLLQKVNDDDDS